MGLMISGLALWCVVHFIPSLGRPLRTAVISAIGENLYKLLFSLLILSALALMVLGWRASVPSYIYDPPAWGGLAATALMVLAVLLFAAARRPTHIKRYVRHPQLSGVALWSLGHLLANGDSRSLALFGTLGLWALAEMVLINRREGTWVKPPAPSVRVELIGLTVTLVVFLLLFALHPYFAGVSIVPA